MIGRGSDAYNRLSSWAGENPVTLAFTAVGIGAVAVFLAISALYFTDQVGQRVTRVEQTPCNRNPAGRACAQTRLEVAKAEPLRNPCASFQRVTSRRGPNCDQFYVARGGRPDSNQDQGSNSGGVGTAPDPGGSDGGSGPVDPGSDPDPSPGKGGGGSGDPKGPGQGGGSGGQAPADPSPVTPPVVQPPPAAEPEPDPPGRGFLNPAIEGVEKGAGEVVGGVGGTAENVGCKLKGTC